MVEVAEQKDSYRELFQAFQGRHREAAPWLQDLRQQALESFVAQGFPTPAAEAWRHTDLRELAAAPRGLRPAEADVDEERLAGFLAASAGFHRLVFVNGSLRPEFSSTERLPEGVRLESLETALAEGRAGVRELMCRRAAGAAHSLIDLNTAFADQGAVLVVPRGQVVEAPIYILHVGAPAADAYMTHPRHLLILEEASQATVIESYVGLDQPPVWTNAVTEIATGPGASLDYYTVVRDGPEAHHLHAILATQDRDSRFRSFALQFTGHVVRTEIIADLDAEGAECDLKGLYLTHGSEHVDNQSLINHRAPHGTSRQVYKGILDGSSSAAFDGKVVVHPGAQKTDAKQQNNNLLLSDVAVINTKPTLEIYADDVKCSHGATTGRLDADALFYLRSRGIGLEDAEALLTYAFASDLVRGIEFAPLREEIDRYIVARIPDRGGLETVS